MITGCTALAAKETKKANHSAAFGMYQIDNMILVTMVRREAALAVCIRSPVMSAIVPNVRAKMTCNALPAVGMVLMRTTLYFSAFSQRLKN